MHSYSKLEMKSSKQLPALMALIGSGFLLLSSIICLALKRSAFDLYRGLTTSTTLSSYPEFGYRGLLGTYPEHLLPVTQGLVIAAASFGIITGFVVLVATGWSMKKQKSFPVDFLNTVRRYLAHVEV